MKQFCITDIDLPKIQSRFPTMAVVQARMGSTRLPKKTLKNVLNKPLLFYLVERLRRVESIDGIIIATTVEAEDDPIEAFCQREGLHVVRASTDDVLSRFMVAANLYDLQSIIRITADCPLIDPEIIEKGVSLFSEYQGNLDYLSNTLERSFARGMDFEIFSRKALETAFFEAKTSHDKEHVTPFIYNHPEKFSLGNLYQTQNDSALRLTIDEKEDFILIETVLSALYPKNPEFTYDDVVCCLKAHPEWQAINAGVKQK